MFWKSANVFVALVLSINLHTARSNFRDFGIQGNEWPQIKNTFMRPAFWPAFEKTLVKAPQKSSLVINYPISNLGNGDQQVTSSNFIDEAAPIINIPFEATIIDPRTADPSLVNAHEQFVQYPFQHFKAIGSNVVRPYFVPEITQPIEHFLQNSIMNPSVTRNMITPPRFVNQAAPIIKYPFKASIIDPRTENKLAPSLQVDESTAVFNKNPIRMIADSTITNGMNEPAPFISDRFEASIVDPRTFK